MYARRLNLNRTKVYKWSWDRRKKEGVLIPTNSVPTNYPTNNNGSNNDIKDLMAENGEPNETESERD